MRIVIGGLRRNGGDGIRVGEKITPRVGVGVGRFAEHIEGMEIARSTRGCSVLQRFGDGTTEHELARQETQRFAHRHARHGFAQPLHQTVHRCAEVVGRSGHVPQGTPAQKQRPGRCVDQTGSGLTPMTRPVTAADLVRDQGI